jgi:protein-tyrosine phosphatase
MFVAGRYRRYRKIDWNEVERLVFVCKGNICRSAFAEIVARSKGVDSVSCGIDTVEGAPANAAAVEAASRKGRDLGLHSTTRINSLSVREGDLYVAMEPWHAAYIEEYFGGSVPCTLLGLWNSPVYPHIQDPYGCTKTYFDHCFSFIERSVCRITCEIKETKAC